MQYKPGQENASPIIFRHLIQKDSDFVTISQPNANFQEQLVLFEYLRTHLNLKALLLPAVFDDMRETGLRKDVMGGLQDPATVSSLQGTSFGNENLTLYMSEEVAENKDLMGLSQTTQEKVEASANDWLARHWPFWARRGEARYALFVALYNFRNSVFGITPQSKRPIIESRYRKIFLP